MHTRIILKVLGLLLMLFSITLIPPIIVSLIYKDGGTYAFTSAFVWMLLVGTVFWFFTRHETHDLKIRDGFLIVVMFWTVLGMVGAIPLYFAAATDISVTDAIFESFSGLTTTGATVLSGLDHLPHALLWYRQQLQWLGGLGIIVLAVAILPMLGIGGMQLYRAEMPGPMKDNKLAPRISETAKTLWLIYLWLTIACATAYWLAGMSGFDAITHSFTTVAIGGFSTHDASMGFFDSTSIEIIAMVFMVLAGFNFILHFTAFRHLSVKPYLNDPEAKTYVVLLAIGIAVATAYLTLHQVYPTWQESLRYGAFQVVSIGTTTGYANADFANWPAFLPVMLIMMSVVGASAGSTGGGIKVIRFILLFKQGSREIKSLLHPNALIPVKLNGKAIPEKVMMAVWGFFSLYIVIFVMLMLLLMALGLDMVTAFSSVTATINNLGPGLGEVSANFQNLSDPVKWVLTFSMVLGRLEIFTLLILFTAAFWRK
ncbi:MAG: TrkH family potassium uptake protein [Hydrogenovibrio sp.]|uniref:TrkH family potassium uptake protein n=1 Tax=Hydrogenovibrio sp. TaxID=2065821 RepID=UPI00286FFF62|nr:TrkH family potassium uptake protein [Hydrogenovibrio sp.]MDR9498362.1 TrkH family potassium uptake protein [Hydrogenovibrio sp.]